MKLSHAIAIMALGLIAIAWHLIGWLSPLTPSEGLPSFIELGLFYFMPIAVLAWCGCKHVSLVRYLYFVLAGLMAIVYAHFYLTVMLQLF